MEIINSDNQELSNKDKNRFDAFKEAFKANYERIIDEMDASVGTKKQYKKRIKNGFILGFFEATDTIGDLKLILRRYKEYLSTCQHLKQNTKSGYLNAVVSILKEMYIRDFIPFDVTTKLRKGIKQERGNRSAYTPEELDRIFDTLSQMEDVQRALRLKVFIALVGFSGLRSQEVCNLKIEDIDLHSGQFQVAAKGGSMDTRAMNTITLSLVKIYIQHQNRNTGYLFQSLSSRNKGGQIATSTLRNYLREICTLAGISLKGLHAFRRGVADRMEANGARMNIIATWLGHTNINTTVQYFRNKEKKERLKEGLDYI